MNQKTFCLLNDSFPPLIDGVANAVVNYAENLSKFGDTPIVVTPSHPQENDQIFPYSVIRYPSLDLREWTGYMAGIPFSPDVTRRLERQHVALLHSHCPVASMLLARELREVVDAPLVLTYHTKFDIDIANLVRSKAIQAGTKRALVRNISACDEVWAVSQGAGENLRSLGYEGDYIVMPNGVDLPRERVSQEEIDRAVSGMDLPQGVPLYLFVGRIMWYKGLRIILDALGKLKASGQDYRMVFIGDGADRQEVEQYAADCGITDKTFFTGSISQRDTLRAWYCRADLFLFPSSFDTNGLVVREAAACSLASVLIEGSCAAEGVTHGRNGLLIAEKAESLCDCLASLTRETMHTLGESASRELYISWETSVRAARERYEVVIDRYKSGLYPSHRQPMDTLLKANGDLMEDLGHLVNLRNKLNRSPLHSRWL